MQGFSGVRQKGGNQDGQPEAYHECQHPWHGLARPLLEGEMGETGGSFPPLPCLSLGPLWAPLWCLPCPFCPGPPLGLLVVPAPWGGLAPAVPGGGGSLSPPRPLGGPLASCLCRGGGLVSCSALSGAPLSAPWPGGGPSPFFTPAPRLCAPFSGCAGPTDPQESGVGARSPSFRPGPAARDRRGGGVKSKTGGPSIPDLGSENSLQIGTEMLDWCSAGCAVISAGYRGWG